MILETIRGRVVAFLHRSVNITLTKLRIENNRSEHCLSTPGPDRKLAVVLLTTQRPAAIDVSQSNGSGDASYAEKKD